MAKRKRRRFTAEFKAEVVLEALSGESSQLVLTLLILGLNYRWHFKSIDMRTPFTKVLLTSLYKRDSLFTPFDSQTHVL